MKAATIVPQSYLHMIENQGYHMALAHMVGEKGYKKYTEFYSKIGRDKNKFLLMDNGEFEGQQQSIDNILRKAYMIHADEIILPDAYQDCDETIERTLDAFGYIITNKKRLMKDHGYIPRLMIVPQGKNVTEWLECAKALIQLNVDSIGIPKVLTKDCPTNRLYVLETLGHSLRGLDVHLLGCWHNPLETAQITKAELNGSIVPVRGIDSAFAYIYAKNDMLLVDGPRPAGTVDFKDMTVDPTILEQNIEYWYRYVRGEYESLPYI